MLSGRVREREISFNDSAGLLSGQRVRKKFTFFIASIARVFAESPEIRFGRGAIPTSFRAAPFKKF
jgi:hypothetical protein